MKLNFTLFAILLNLASIAQDWTPFPYNQKTWFEFSNATHQAVSQYYSDSLLLQGDSTHYYYHLKYINDRISGADASGVYSSCLNEPAIVGSTEVGKTWLDYYESKVMDFISIKNPYTEINGSYFYKGNLVFNPNLKLDESIAITSDSYTGFDEVQIKCVEIKQMDVLGELDSVKIFSLQSYANDGPVESDFNNSQYILSKNHGFITFLPFIELLDQPKTTATLAAFENETGNLVGQLLGNYIKTYEVGDVIEKLDTRIFYRGGPPSGDEVIYTKDSITSVQIDENYFTYNFNRLEITEKILPPLPPGSPPYETTDTTYYTNQQVEILLSNLELDPNSVYFFSIYGAILPEVRYEPFNIRLEPFNFSFTDKNVSINRIVDDFQGTLLPEPEDCISQILPNINLGTSVYNSELGLLRSWESLEVGATFTTDLLTYTKKNKAYTPFTTLNPVYYVADTLINLKNDYHPTSVQFSGPGVDWESFNPSLVPDSLHNQLIEITCSHYLGWSTTQTVLVRSTGDCNCDNNYQPVCGEDGNSYDNACLAQCKGIAITYEGACGSISCDDPLQLEIVQQAINEGCAELIYKNGSEIFIDKTCDGSGLIYNCETQTTCSYNSNESLEENCSVDIYNLSLSLSEGEVIWSKPCSYENQGVVVFSDIACGPACDAVGYFIILENRTALYPIGIDDISLEVYRDKTVRFSYVEIPNIEFYANGTRALSVLTCIEIVEEEQSSGFFADYPWLTNLIDEQNCAGGTKVSEYAYNESYNFIHIEQAGGSSALYFQDGAFYCADAPNYSCLSLYGLTNSTGNWQCQNENPDPPVEETVFDQYTWLNTLVDAETCSAGSSIEVYSYGTYTFIFIEDDNGGSLYFEDGTFYCADATNYSCVQLYGLTNPKTRWVCENENPEPPSNQTVFDQYSWLNTLIDSTDCAVESKVTVYPYGTYSFVFIEDANGSNLYFEDGTFYCKDAPGYSCVQLYGLINPTSSWVCGNENLTGTCVVDNPFSLSWFQELIAEASQDLCGIKEINQTSYEGNTYFVARIQPIYPECASDGLGTIILDCNGNNVCSINPWLMPGEVNCPDNPELLALNFTGELIWSYDYTNPQTNIDIFNEYLWINSIVSPNYCEAGNAITMYTEGIDPVFYIENADGAELRAKGGSIICTDSIGFSCVEANSLSEVITSWTCDSTVTCVAGDPFSLSWFQELIASQNDCGIKEIYQGSRYGSTYFIANRIPCTADGKVEEVYDCNGNIICNVGAFQAIPDTPIPGYSYCPLFPYIPIISSPGIELIWSYDPGTNKTSSENLISDSEKLTFNEEYKVYPNPGNGQFTIELSQNKTSYTHLELSNLQGEILEKITISADPAIKEIDLTHLPKGMYIMQAKSETTTITQKIIIR